MKIGMDESTNVEEDTINVQSTADDALTCSCILKPTDILTMLHSDKKQMAKC